MARKRFTAKIAYSSMRFRGPCPRKLSSSTYVNHAIPSPQAQTRTFGQVNFPHQNRKAKSWQIPMASFLRLIPPAEQDSMQIHPSTEPRWHRFATAEAVATQAAQWIQQRAAEAIAARGVFNIVLAGGTTPAVTYKQLANQAEDWSRWNLYLGDERCLPSEDAARNSTLVQQNWSTPSGPQLHAIPAEQGSVLAATAYARLVESVVPFDLVLLGLGEDGHTASLFPGHIHPEQAWVHAVHNAPKPPPERVSLSIKALSQTRHLYFLVCGRNKQKAVQAWRQGQPIPAAALDCPAGVDVLLDQTAWEQ